jgi:DNA-binding response OmpR family regulator
MTARVLVADNDKRWVETLSIWLSRAGYEIDRAEDGAAAITKATEENFAIILLDMALPLRHGFEVCREVRARGVMAPILMVSTPSDVDAKACAFKAGADGFLTKPPDLSELLARMDALLRRAPANHSTRLATHRFGDVIVDFGAAVVTRQGCAVDVSPKELALLQYLIARRGTPVRREELLSALWGFVDQTSRTVDVHVAALRQSWRPCRAGRVTSELFAASVMSSGISRRNRDFAGRRSPGKRDSDRLYGLLAPAQRYGEALFSAQVEMRRSAAGVERLKRC